MEFLTKELTQIQGFSIALWHILVAVAVLVLLVVAIVGICRGASNRKKNKKIAQTAEVADEVATDDIADDELVDEVIVTIDEDADDEPTQPTAEVDTESALDAPAPQVEQPVEPTEQPAETTEQPVAKKPTVKNYHIALRPDGKWQVKLSKGGKAIKLFDTQAEAIAFAKARAKSQDGHITIHKVDGKIRKQKY